VDTHDGRNTDDVMSRPKCVDAIRFAAPAATYRKLLGPVPSGTNALEAYLDVPILLTNASKISARSHRAKRT
jgi:hypothetical protein